ncbi:MAG: RNA-binding S4 domain-containing protein [Peptococcaceae bacterium]
MKVSRIIKRRSIAKEICQQGQVWVNGQRAKAGTAVKAGDILEFKYDYRQLKVKICFIQENVPARQATEMYQLLKD